LRAETLFLKIRMPSSVCRAVLLHPEMCVVKGDPNCVCVCARVFVCARTRDGDEGCGEAGGRRGGWRCTCGYRKRRERKRGRGGSWARAASTLVCSSRTRSAAAPRGEATATSASAATASTATATREPCATRAPRAMGFSRSGTAGQRKLDHSQKAERRKGEEGLDQPKTQDPRPKTFSTNSRPCSPTQRQIMRAEAHDTPQDMSVKMWLVNAGVP
jgi:hypothetical protein